MKILLKFTLIIILLVAVNACKKNTNNPKTFNGEEKAVKLAEQMFEAIGGKEEWCNLKSLYIKAEHSEPDMSIPYKSEIWRATDRFELIIEQQNDSFHVKAVVNNKEGTIRYYDRRDTVRTLSEEQLKNWKYDHFNNVYVLINNLGCNPEEYKVKIDSEERLVFYKDSTLKVMFGLDDKHRPFKFFRPNLNGKVSGSIVSRWGTDNGLVHSAGGHPIDSNFVYITEIWKPSKLSIKEAFGEGVFNTE